VKSGQQQSVCLCLSSKSCVDVEVELLVVVRLVGVRRMLLKNDSFTSRRETRKKRKSNRAIATEPKRECLCGLFCIHSQ